MSFAYIDVLIEYEKDKNLNSDDVNKLLKWIHIQPHLPKLSELQAILFLQSCYYNIEAAKIAVDKYYTIRTLSTEIFAHRDPKWPSAIEAMNTMIMTMLPKATHKNYRVFFTKIMNTEASKFNFPAQIRQFDMIVSLDLHQNGTADGLVIVFDFEGAHLGHLTRFNPAHMKKVMCYLQEAIPIRLKGYHFINPIKYMDTFLGMMRPFMKKELFNMMYVHNKLEDLFEFVPQECLPQEYGGTCDSVPVLHEKNISHINRNSEYFDDDRKLVVDESKRTEKPRTVGWLYRH